MKKRTVFAVFTLIACLLLAACQGSGGGAGGGNAGGGGSGGGGAKKSNKKITLTWMRGGGARETAVLEDAGARAFWAMVDKFQEENPNVTIEHNLSDQADFHQKIMALAAAENMPDIFDTKGSWVQTFYDNNLMGDLTNDIDVNLYRSGIFKPFTRGGKIYVLPTQFLITSVGYYNKAMWADAGFDKFPDNWDDVFKADEYFKSQGIVTIAHGNKDAWPYESCIISALGDRFTGSGWTESIILNDGKAKFTDPEFVECLRLSQKIATLFNPDFNAITNGVADALFATGKAASTWEGSWTVNYFLEGADVDPEVLKNIEMTLLPQVPNQKGAPNAVSGGTGWGVSINSKLEGDKRAAAVELIKTTTGRGYCEHLMADNGMPSQIDVPLADKSSMSELAVKYNEWASTVELVPIYDIQMDGAVIDIMNMRLQNLLAGSATPEELAAEIQAAQDKLTFGAAAASK